MMGPFITRGNQTQTHRRKAMGTRRERTATCEPRSEASEETQPANIFVQGLRQPRRSWNGKQRGCSCPGAAAAAARGQRALAGSTRLCPSERPALPSPGPALTPLAGQHPHACPAVPGRPLPSLPASRTLDSFSSLPAWLQDLYAGSRFTEPSRVTRTHGWRLHGHSPLSAPTAVTAPS